MTYFIETEQGGFHYTLERRARRTVAIRVKPDGSVLVAAPMLVPHLFVKGFLRDQAGWVHRKRAEMLGAQQQFETRSYTEGSTISYLGREYRLAFAGRSRLDEHAGVLHLGLRGEPDREKVIAALTRWYKQQARLVLTGRMAMLAEQLGRSPALVGIKSYRSRWGSCHADGRIYFSWRLIMAPLDVIDYVAAHELCHLLHPNHSAAFWHEVEQLFPAFREQRVWLKRQGRLLDL